MKGKNEKQCSDNDIVHVVPRIKILCSDRASAAARQNKISLSTHASYWPNMNLSFPSFYINGLGLEKT